MTATNMCSNFGSFGLSPPLMIQYALALDVIKFLMVARNYFQPF